MRDSVAEMVNPVTQASLLLLDPRVQWLKKVARADMYDANFFVLGFH